MYKIMLVEDDETLRKHIAQYLSKYHYVVSSVVDFEDIIKQFDGIDPHMVILDINLPFYDGFHLCKAFRKKSSIPILMISARSGSTEQVLGIELGADDYITKPINLEILLSKIKSILRRAYGEYSSSKANALKVKGLWLEEGSFKLFYRNNCAELSKNEFKLIRKLMEEQDHFVSREELLEELWNDISFVDDNTLSVNIKRLKDKFREFGLEGLVKTKRGVGYMLDSNRLEGGHCEEDSI